MSAKGKKTILVSGNDPEIFLRQLAVNLARTGMSVVIGGCGLDDLTYDIESIEPAVVFIWNTYDENGIVRFLWKWKYSQVRPFFIITTSDRRVYDILCDSIPGNAHVILEPERMGYIRELIIRAVNGELSFGNYE